jgi:hypothetical protein
LLGTIDLIRRIPNQETINEFCPEMTRNNELPTVPAISLPTKRDKTRNKRREISKSWAFVSTFFDKTDPFLEL